MGLLDAIDKLLEPITKRIFATKLGKSIRPLTGEELNKLYTNSPNYDHLPANTWYLSKND